jgi:hypothetical protein
LQIVSLGFRTDLMVLALGGSEIEHGERHVVVRTPANPTFWWGNFVLFADPVGPGEIPERLALFADAFPEPSTSPGGSTPSTGRSARRPISRARASS